MGNEGSLRTRIDRIAGEAGAKTVAIAYHDYETDVAGSVRPHRWFHAASTVKIPILLGVYGAIAEERLAPHSRVHVRNRFLSVHDGSVFRVESSRDANEEVHDALGKMLYVEQLAHHMIATSSNLATNLLVDVVGLESTQRTLRDLGIHEGVELVRGVEDEHAYEAGINNRVTAHGLLQCLRPLVEERGFSPELTRAMLDILHAQEFNSGIPAGVPRNARVAHKTGEISTVAHDAGIVFLPNREPYLLVVLTEWTPEGSGRKPMIAEISRAVYEHLTQEDYDE